MGLTKPTENTGGTKPVAHNDTVFAQVLKLVPRHEFESLARKHKSGRMSRSMTRWGQFVAMGMAQLTGRCSLRDIVSNLAAPSCKLYHLGVSKLLDRLNTRPFRKLPRGLTADECAAILERAETAGVSSTA